MRKILLAILVVLMASALVAQTNVPVESIDSYIVQPKDSPWGLAQAYRQNGDAWRDLIVLNPWMKERITELPNGEAHVLIYPGEVIKGITRAEAMGEEPITVNLGVPEIPAPAPMVQEVEQPSQLTYFTEPTNQFAWPWLLMILAAVALVWWTLRYFNRPATAGRPVLEGGIRSTHVAEDMDAAVAAAQSRNFMGSTGTNSATNQRPVRIGPIYEATFHGPGRAGYATNLRPRHFNGEHGYQARYRFANGNEEDVNFMQACGNDFTYMNMRYFPSEVRRGAMVVPAPAATTTTSRAATATAATGTTPVAPEPNPTTPSPAAPAEPAPALAAVIPIGNPGANGTTAIVVGETEFNFTSGARIEVKPNGSAEITLANGTVISAVPQKPKKARKASSPAAPATGTAS